MRLLAMILLIGMAAAPAIAQFTGRNADPAKTAHADFSADTQLIIQTVTATGRDGKPIPGLTSQDFAVTEDGVPQAIRVFEYQEVAAEAESAPAPPDPESVQIYDRLSRSRIEAGAPGSVQYNNRRLLALYFDMTAMQAADQFRALAAAQHFIRTQMTAADLIAILRYEGGSVDVLQDFTDDRGRLLGILQTLVVGEGQGFAGSSGDESTPDSGAAFGQDDSEFNIFNTDRQLSALQTAAQMLGRLNENKVLVYFAGGLRLNGLHNQAQLRATVNAAIRAGVSFWPVDARGLVAHPPLGDATLRSPGNTGIYSGAGTNAVATNFQRSQDTLYALGADTGGKAFLDSNDLSAGIVQAARSITSYYIIGYYTTNPEPDGKFRRIRVSLKGNQSAKLDYRQGYFAPKHFAKFNAAEKERQLEDALMLPDPITELTIAMEIDYFQLNRAEYFVPVAVKIPGRELALAKQRGAERTTIDFIGEIKNAAGTTVTNVRDKLSAKLDHEMAAELAKRPIVYDTAFTLLPGQYTIKFLARDTETGRIGTFQATFVIPNLNNNERQRLPISSVVLSSQRVDLKSALGTAGKERDRRDELNPLVNEGQKLVPSVTRVFSGDRSMYVYLQAYRPGAAESQPLVVAVSFYRENEVAFRVAPVEIAQTRKDSLRTTPVFVEIPLKGLPAGKYECQVTVLDPMGERAAFWQAPLVVVR